VPTLSSRRRDSPGTTNGEDYPDRDPSGAGVHGGVGGAAGPRMRLRRDEVERLMEGRPAGTGLEDALEVFEVFASGTLSDEVYILEDVGGKRIAIAPAALKAKYRKE
jgi:hypothetical protein